MLWTEYVLCAKFDGHKIFFSLDFEPTKDRSREIVQFVNANVSTRRIRDRAFFEWEKPLHKSGGY